MGLLIKAYRILGRITGSEKIPVSDGGDLPKAVTTKQLKDFVLKYVVGEENVQSDWEEKNEDSDAFIKNKPTIPEEVTEQTVSDWGFATTSVMNEALSGKVDKVNGKQLSTEDFTTALKNKLNGLSNYDDTAIAAAVSKLRADFDTLVGGDTTSAIKSFNDIVAFLDGISDSEDLESIIASIEQQIASKQEKIDDLATIRSGAALGATALQEHQDISGKVDKVSGKGLSTNDYTTNEKNKLSGIESGAEVNVQSDWNATSGDAFIKNKPTLATVATSGSYNDLTNKPTIPSAITVDSSLSSTSTNPVQNKVINSALSGKLSTSGTAASATKLATKRTIWGQEFDGTANIAGNMTVPDTFIIKNASRTVFSSISSGNVGIRTSPSTSYNVYVAGGTYFDSSVTVNTTVTANSSLVVKGAAALSSTFSVEGNSTFYKALYMYSGSVLYGYGSDGKYQKCLWPRASDITYLNYGTKGFKIRNNSSTEVMVIDANDATTFKKDVTVSGTFSNPSSLVLKNVIDRDGLTLEQLSKIKPARFTWKDGKDSLVHIGGIADEVKEIMPEVIHEQEDGTYTMEYANAAFAMVSSLVKYVEQNQKRIEDLEKEIEQLKSRL